MSLFYSNRNNNNFLLENNNNNNKNNKNKNNNNNNKNNNIYRDISPLRKYNNNSNNLKKIKNNNNNNKIILNKKNIYNNNTFYINNKKINFSNNLNMYINVNIKKQNNFNFFNNYTINNYSRNFKINTPKKIIHKNNSYTDIKKSNKNFKINNNNNINNIKRANTPNPNSKSLNLNNNKNNNKNNIKNNNKNNNNKNNNKNNNNKSNNKNNIKNNNKNIFNNNKEKRNIKNNNNNKLNNNSINNSIINNNSHNSNIFKSHFKSKNIFKFIQKSKSKTNIQTNSNNKNNNNNNKNEIKNLNSNLLEKLNTSLNISPSNENFSFKIENNTNSSFSDTIIINNINNNINNNSTEKKILKKIKCMHEFTKTGFAGEDEKKINQDNFFVFHNFLNSSTYIFMAILDGHGEVGQEISGYIKENLPLNLNKTLKESNINIENNNINEIINEVFIEENYLLVTNDKINSMLSGSTCAGLIYTPSKLISINVGDSRIILGKNINNKFINYDLTTDHKPSLIEESKRILNRGGEIYPMKDTEGNFIGPERVWIKNEEYPGLAMSRSFGDRIAHSVGVIVEPEIREYFFKEEDMFIVLGSDGLFEFISSQEVVDIVKKYYIENDIVSCCEELYKISCERWMKEEEVIDDITIIVIFLE